MTGSLSGRRSFLKKVSTTYVAGPFLLPHSALTAPATVPVAVTPHQARYIDIGTRSLGLLAQMARGLSYGGKSRDAVSRRNPLSLQVTVSQLATYLAIIASRADRFASDVVQADQRYQELTDSVSAAQGRRFARTAEITALTSAWNEINKKLSTLDQFVRDGNIALDKAQLDFQTAVIAATSQGCGFLDIVKAVAAIVAIANGIAAAAPALASAVSKLESGGFGFDNLREVSKILQPVNGNMQDIVDGYNKIRPYLDSAGRGALVVIPTDSLDAHVDDVMKSIDAVNGAPLSARLAFKQAIRTYVDAAQARNNAILTMDNIASKVRADLIEIKSLKSQEDRLSDVATGAYRPEAREIAASLRIIQRSFLRQLRDFLWDTNRSIDYYTLRPYAPDPLLSTADAANIVRAIGNSTVSLESFLNNLPGNPEVFPIRGIGPFRLRFVLGAQELKSLASGRLLISARPTLHRPSAYERAYVVFASDIQVSIDGVSIFSGYLTHLGLSRFESRPGAAIEFRTATEVRRLTEQKLGLGVGTNALAGGAWSAAPSEAYLGLSPYSDWLIEIDRPSQIRVLAMAKFIDLDFWGQMRSA